MLTYCWKVQLFDLASSHFNQCINLYGLCCIFQGIFEDKAGKCHNSTVAKDQEAIVYLEQKSNGDLLMKYLNDPIYFQDELTICGQDPPKLVSGRIIKTLLNLLKCFLGMDNLLINLFLLLFIMIISILFMKEICVYQQVF